MRKMKSFNFQMQRYVAHLSVGASTVRGQRTRGLVAACREELELVDLHSFGTSSGTRFKNRLSDETINIRGRLPNGCRHWGLARKVLNIFLRCSLYNSYLREHFGLDAAEAFFEIPLDKFTARGISNRSPPGSLPKWLGVKYLTASDSDQFQNAASKIAAKTQLARVHLDITLWLERK